MTDLLLRSDQEVFFQCLLLAFYLVDLNLCLDEALDQERNILTPGLDL